jgi:hypothetical protein
VSKFRKKPDIVDAFRWTGGPDQTEDPEWIVKAIENNWVRIIDSPDHTTLFMVINLPDGEEIVFPGQYVILTDDNQITGEDEDKFLAKYEPA